MKKISLAELKQFISAGSYNRFVLSSNNQPEYSNVSFNLIFSTMSAGHSHGSVALVGENSRLFFNGVEHIEITDETEVSVSINIVYHDPFNKDKKYKARILAIKGD